MVTDLFCFKKIRDGFAENGEQVFDLDFWTLEELSQGLADGGQAVVSCRLPVISCCRALLGCPYVISHVLEHGGGQAGSLQQLLHGLVAVLFGLEVGPGCVGYQADSAAVWSEAAIGVVDAQV